jgi:pimeloyl-ACP methyl ester carboxylesterase
MYEKVMERLVAERGLHVIAMDYPSFGYSDVPDRGTYAFTFDHVSQTVRHFLHQRGIKRYALYMQDYGVPVGFRLISADPGAVTAIRYGRSLYRCGFRPHGFPSKQLMKRNRAALP